MSRLTLFVVIDSTQEYQRALVPAAEIDGGHTHASRAVSEKDLAGYTSKRDAKHAVKHRAGYWVDEMINPLINDQVTVSREIARNDHWYQAAVHARAKVGADYVIKSTDTQRSPVFLNCRVSGRVETMINCRANES